jgi:hypothetical protein
VRVQFLTRKKNVFFSFGVVDFSIFFTRSTSNLTDPIKVNKSANKSTTGDARSRVLFVAKNITWRIRTYIRKLNFETKFAETVLHVS